MINNQNPKQFRILIFGYFSIIDNWNLVIDYLRTEQGFGLKVSKGEHSKTRGAYCG
ncbi:MAG: hypothetical protein UX60_C0002G0002 [Berkelbacteria bacterium GW2011_GWA2_46_7]|uniref:Uncharacterized protein n=1 Tax=Berkelbacteria bacterium GW2011_GWA2_46_7 TaxID=1618335 RepID=A0A0G1QHQ0_9BACT|nr:MAG: hypothetical protein UX60_C0002G0002 [Berkelbacteria bacterium GW2011_GWA2_46_7]